MIYCISDIHGRYEQYLELLDQIHFSDQDTLYVLGDVLDRGEDSIKVLKDMMYRSNVFPIIGNHEFMALVSLQIFMTEITHDFLESLDEETLLGLANWFENGGKSTFNEFTKLSLEEKEEIMDYLGEFVLYKEIEVNGNEFVLVHGGLKNFLPTRPLDSYSLEEIIWDRPDYSKVYFKDKYLVTGHTPTFLCDENCKEGTILMKNNHIAIDCGSVFGGQLGAICLDTFETFYVK